jgi:hypothetical protein
MAFHSCGVNWHLLGCVRMTATEFNVNRVLVVNDASDSGHGRVDQLLLVNEGALLQFVRQRARIGQERHVREPVIAAPCVPIAAKSRKGQRGGRDKEKINTADWLIPSHSRTGNMDAAMIHQVNAAHVAVQAHFAIAFGILVHTGRRSNILDAIH